MNKVWKWILGILLILVIVGGISALAYRQHDGAAFTEPRPPRAQAGGGPEMPKHDGGPGIDRDFDRHHGPEKGRHAFMLRGAGLFVLGQLISLALVTLLVFGAYQLGKRAGMASLNASSPTQTQSARSTRKKSS